ncbi:MAG: VPGUxxT family thioredoxin-like (seleno)protein, type 2 [Planctomycetota bacterium]
MSVWSIRRKPLSASGGNAPHASCHADLANHPTILVLLRFSLSKTMTANDSSFRTPSMFSRLICVGILAVMASTTMATDGTPKNPIEVGTVKWSRDLAAAQSASQSDGRPVLVLFQEVPGCAGCQQFGKTVLSHPLMVEAIEENFHPVLVFNNRSSGRDKELLDRYNEPAWNYQVVRFLDAKGKDIIPRKDRIWSITALANRMIETLRASNRDVPRYLTTLGPIATADQLGSVALSMHCYWTGEYRLGKIDGVVATQAGWLDGREVTLVRYDKERINLEQLAAQAAKVKCADTIYTSAGESIAGLPGGKLDDSYRVAKSSDQKYQLHRWKALQAVKGLTPMQLTKLNAIAPDSIANAVQWLSPRQREQLKMAAARQPAAGQ